MNSLYSEINEIKALYEMTTMEEARTSYDQYVNIIITEADISKLEKEALFDSWEKMKDGK